MGRGGVIHIAARFLFLMNSKDPFARATETQFGRREGKTANSQENL
jgi:hypothetical protein